MFAIVGLGNPGEKYRNNRHNVGFMMVDSMAHNLDFKPEKYTKSEVAKTKINNKDVLLVKPQTFMNLSGQSVKQIVKINTVSLNRLILIHDDLDIPLGKFKIQKGVGPLLHNGIESIEKVLGNKDFWRVRIGVDNRGKNWTDGETYVLRDFTPEEKSILDQTFPAIYSRLVSHFPDLL